MTAFPFIAGAYRARSKNFDAQRCVNLYPEVGSGTSKSVAMLVGTPGMEPWTSLAATLATSVRGLYRFSDSIAIAVTTDTVYTVDTAGIATAIGSITAAATLVSMADNGSVVMLVTGAQGYFIDPAAGTVTPILDPDFVAGARVNFLAGRFVWPQANTGRFQWTSVYGTDVDALSFATAEASPDVIISQIAGFGELWEFGVNSTEVFQPSGDADQPFAKVQGAAMEIGCAATYSVAKIDSSFFWLGRSDEGTGIVWRAVNYQPQRVSTHAIEFAIASYGDISDAIGFTYQQEGHSFYVLSFPSADKTWCYDVATNLWHERAWRDPATGDLHAIRAQCQMEFANSIVVGDRASFNLHKWKLDVFTDLVTSDPIARIRACAHLHADLKSQFFKSLQIDMETGVGLSVDPGDPGYDPQIMLRWSDDGGHTWSNSHWTTMGRIGEYRTRARWRRLGWSRDRVFEATITEPVKVCLIGASAEVVVGAN